MHIKITLLILIGVVFAACAKPPVTASQLHGQWSFEDGVKRITLTFVPDGTYTLQRTSKPAKSIAAVMGQNMMLIVLPDDGTWKLTGRNKLFFRGKSGVCLEFQHIRIQGRTLTCRIGEESKATFTKID
jgi:hypothetical protein